MPGPSMRTRLLEQDKPDTPSPVSLLRYCVTSRLFNSAAAQWHCPSAQWHCPSAAALAASSSLAGDIRGSFDTIIDWDSWFIPLRILWMGCEPHQHACRTQTRGLDSSFRRETACSSSAPAQTAPAALPPRHSAAPAGPARSHHIPHAFSWRTCSSRGRSQSGAEPSEHPDRGRLPGAAEQRPGPSAAGAGTRGSTLGEGDRDGAGDAEGWDPGRTGTAWDPPLALKGDARGEAALHVFPMPLPPLPPGTRPSSRQNPSRRHGPRHRPRAAAPLAGRARTAPARQRLGSTRRPPRWRRCHSDSGRESGGRWRSAGRLWCCHPSESLWLREAGGRLSRPCFSYR